MTKDIGSITGTQAISSESENKLNSRFSPSPLLRQFSVLFFACSRTGNEARIRICFDWARCRHWSPYATCRPYVDTTATLVCSVRYSRWSPYATCRPYVDTTSLCFRLPELFSIDRFSGPPQVARQLYADSLPLGAIIYSYRFLT
jgi:hypothetical protein